MRLGILLLIMALATEVIADPRMWEPTGRLIRGEGPVKTPSAATNVNGYTLVAWVDQEDESGDIWGQLYNPAGIQQWGEHGRRLLGTEQAEKGVKVAAWQDGFILGFVRAVLPNYSGDLFLCPINLQGEAVWTQNGGTGVQATTATLISPRFNEIIVMEDGMVTYSYEAREPGVDTMRAFINWTDAFGNVQLDNSIEIVGQHYYWTGLHGIAASSSQGIYVARAEFADDVWHHTLMNYDFNGEINWEVEIATDPYLSWRQPIALIDGIGCFIAYPDYTSSSDRLLVQLYDSSGAELWANPVVLANDLVWGVPYGIQPSIELGDTTGLLVMWTRDPGGSNDTIAYYAQKLSFEGDLIWQPGGVIFCQWRESNQSEYREFMSDHVGGLLSCGEHWQHVSGGTRRVVSLSRITAAGGVDWGDSCGIHLLDVVWNGYDPVTKVSLNVGESNNAFVTTVDFGGNNALRMKTLDKISGEFTGPPDGHILASGSDLNCHFTRATKLSNGNSALCWTDGRSESANGQQPRFQIVTPSGPLLADALGCRLFPMWDEVYPNYDICPDETGGFYCVGHPFTYDDFEIRATHIRSDGTQFGDSNGVVIAESDGVLARAICAPDRTGGLYIVWQAHVNSPLRTYVQRFDSTLQSVWPIPLLISSFNSDARIQEILLTNTGDCILLSSQLYVLRVSKISQIGSLEWTTDVTQSFDYMSSSSPEAVELPTGEIVALWAQVESNPARTAMRGQKLTDSGEEHFVHGGVVVADSVSTFDVALSTPADPIVMYVKELDTYEHRAYVTKLDTNLRSAWGDRGVEVTPEHFYGSWDVDFVADNDGGVFVASTSDVSLSGVSAVHLNSDGNITNDYWLGGGVICDALGLKGNVAVAQGRDSGQFYCFWEDNRNYSQIFGQYIDETTTSANPPHAPIPSQITLSQNYPNPFNANTEIVFSLPHAIKATLQVFDVTGRLVTTLADRQFIAGEHRIAFDASGLASGIYFYELRSGDTKVARKMLLLK